MNQINLANNSNYVIFLTKPRRKLKKDLQDKALSLFYKMFDQEKHHLRFHNWNLAFHLSDDDFTIVLNSFNINKSTQNDQ